MTTTIRRSVAMIAVLLISTAAAAIPAGQQAGAAAQSPQGPQVSQARAAATWLAAQFNAQGYIPLASSTEPDLSSTAQAILALSAANVAPTTAQSALRYMEANVNAYVTVDGADGPGQLAVLILDAIALGASPTDFGGTNLVARLLATEQTSGPDAGVFGTETQLSDEYTGTLDQGLALAALAAAGVTSQSQVGAPINWLLAQQCPNGGWTLPDQSLNPCNGDPADWEGPDTNSTADAIEGLVAQDAAGTDVGSSALSFFEAAQDADAGWSYFPNTTATPGVSDPDSTSLVVQALVTLGDSPTSGKFTVGGANPLSTLESFQFTSGPSAGAFYFPPAPAPASLLATYQAVPALLGLPSTFGPSGRSYWLAGADGGVHPYGGAAGYGSLTSVGVQATDIKGLVSSADGKGYWLVGADGGVFAFGDAKFYGSAGSMDLGAPIVAMAATPDGRGYWLAGADGGVFAFGDAAFDGSMGGQPLKQPIVGIAATPDGRGYWLVASDGGVFAFGDARFHGSAGSLTLNAPVVGMAATPDGNGYWLVASDGGVFAFGDAKFYGAASSFSLNAAVVGIAATPDGDGYWLAGSDGGVFAFGDAPFVGAAAGQGSADVVSIASSPVRPT